MTGWRRPLVWGFLIFALVYGGWQGLKGWDRSIEWPLPESLKPDAAAVASLGTLEGDQERAGLYLAQARESFDKLQSYQTEFIRSDLSPKGLWRTEKIFLKFEKPFHIYFKWLEGERKGTELLYARGYFDDKILIRLPGVLFRIVPIIRLAKNDPRLGEEETHSIDKAGIGYFLEDFGLSFDESLASGKMKVLSIEPTSVDGEKGTRVSILFDNPDYDYPRTDVVYSTETRLPLEVGLFNRESELVEIYRYLKFKPDTPRNDPHFSDLADSRFERFFRDLPK